MARFIVFILLIFLLYLAFVYGGAEYSSNDNKKTKSNIKPFYIWPKEKKENLSGGFDALFGGVEISSGGQRVHDSKILIEQLKSKGLKPESFDWYVNAFRHGAPHHSGWSIGLERLTKAILNLDNIREATLFPRDRRRLTP